MTGTTAVHDVLGQLGADARQLVEPFTIPVAQRPRGGRTRWHAITHPALLDQLRAAVAPGSAVRGPERRRIPDSRPPAALDVVDALTDVTVGISGWHARLRLPSPPEWRYGCRHWTCSESLLYRPAGRPGPVCAQAALERLDWQKEALRQLVDRAPRLAPSIADELAADVSAWWWKAAKATGWQADDLRNAR